MKSVRWREFLQTLKRRWLRLKLWWNPTNIEFGGKCRRCGVCCRNLMLQIGDEPIATEEEFAEVCREYPEYRIFRIKRKEADGYLLFECTKIGKNNLCTIYPDRPGVCRSYPTKKVVMLGYDRLEDCGYNLKATVSFRNMLDLKQRETEQSNHEMQMEDQQ